MNVGFVEHISNLDLSLEGSNHVYGVLGRVVTVVVKYPQLGDPVVPVVLPVPVVIN